MDLLFVPASFSPTTLVVKPSVLLSPRASHKPPPEAAAGAAAPLSSATIRRPLNPPFRQTSPVEPDTAPSTALKPSTTNPLAPKLWLSSKLSPPPPPPPLPPAETLPLDSDVEDPPSPAVNPDSMADAAKYRVKGKIFVGNLPRWVKKNAIVEFFRQFGPVEKCELITAHDDPERNMGYCFLLYGGPTAEDSAVRAVEFDGVEFHGRVLTVRLDDGSQQRARKEEKMNWVAGSDRREYKSKLHAERGNARNIFVKVLDTKLEDWQAVVSACDKIPKPSLGDYLLMVKYYARRGDKHHARQHEQLLRA
ncbi:pentatricopeptide repeat-containing protein At5g04810, chloroplastic-like isoform X1 [Zingiber officinale]|uniref:pentatricopeptide repeat-containing protein At5g04810, chloroplastic-like isoform X1 n=1 Tax=Zingiber officinale TaxID=94328 RepID=UPI001C4B9F02|nr:pentatricopeptide repeat-containing protein At5g04810, chloroplastic-like isoform X1 [Zingiber officinale]XP_042415671.1 pentatricopeptide repeat-containing protein At5g04810, chloroplastic-like isoform X1 [Zingiber officinale]XP_042415672.1 pentatricopeptide repeat-containing protein At5g04810, chloroplastic-like isoform X1 [Zingiber officinale]XP_042415673.1 pentatricopeptide repeat-containing protein At5g04810, chloroplastic-like isoform X1 [Zingiber officinale]